MKSELQRVSLALAGAAATTPTARMVRVGNGRIEAYGGVFSISVPWTGVPLECWFNPQPLLDFYTVPREGETFTIQEENLIVRHGSRTVKLRTLPYSAGTTLSVIAPQKEVSLNIESLRYAAKIARKFSDQSFDIEFRDGWVIAGSRQFLFYGLSGMPPDVRTVLPIQTVETIVNLGTVTSYACDNRQNYRFFFDDGTWLSTRSLQGREFPGTVFELWKERKEKHSINFRNLDELRSVKCDLWKLCASSGIMEYTTEDGTSGTVEEAYEGEIDGTLSNSALQFLLSLPDAQFRILDRCRIMATREPMAFITTLSWNNAV